MHHKTPLQFTEQEIMASLQGGQPEALGWLYDKFAPVLTGLAIRIMGNQEMAEAVLQETFVTIWLRKDTYESSRLSVLSWLILITRDTAMAALKSGKYQELKNNGEFPDPLVEKNKDSNPGKTDLNIKESFCKLETDEKAALDLVYLKGYLCAEAASELGISLETLQNRLKGACKHLKEGGAK